MSKSGNKFSFTKKSRIFAKTDGRCGYCGTLLDIERFAIDHIHPKIEGGSNDDENLLPVCWSCNSGKGTKSIEDYRLFAMVKEATGGVTVFGMVQATYLRDVGALPALGINDNFKFYFERREVAA